MTNWSSIPAFTVVIPITAFDQQVTEIGLQHAVKLREALKENCHKLLPDNTFELLDAKRRSGQSMSQKEQQYLNQAEMNYEEMVVDKMAMAILYEGDWNALSFVERATLDQLMEKVPGGCSLVTSRAALGDRPTFMINRRAPITSRDARNEIRKMIGSKSSSVGRLLMIAIILAAAFLAWRYLR